MNQPSNHSPRPTSDLWARFRFSVVGSLLPSEGLLVTPQIENFAWRVEQLVTEGGFALIRGESGTGKSVALRIVAERFAALRDVVVGVLERPQSKSADFYRELGDIFSVERLVLSSEHRAAAAAPPVYLELVTADADTTHLAVSGELREEARRDLQQRVLELLAPGSMWTRAKMREQLSVKNERLGEALESLEQAGRIRRTAVGWQPAE